MKWDNVFPGRDFRKDVEIVLGRISDVYGVEYPEGYVDVLVEKYKEKVPFPHVFIRTGEDRLKSINKDYQRILEKVKNGGKILDYGAGYGESGRLLVNDGCSKENIVMFDVVPKTKEMGYDLFLDQYEWDDNFVVANPEDFSFENEFDVVYSGSVFHCISHEDDRKKYLQNAFNALKEGGEFIGTTLGGNKSKDEYLFLPDKADFENYLRDVGFGEIEVKEGENPSPHGTGFNCSRLWFSAWK
jgi:SAM-dependent methyltransferase